MRILLKFCDGSLQEIVNYIHLELSSAVNVACDGLRLTFCSDKPVSEVNEVYVYSDNILLFFGYADIQKSKISAAGCEQFIYARSNASILVDNEARPITLKNPTSAQLFENYASAFGFTNELPGVTVEDMYTISKGTSCYGVLDQFIRTLYGNPIRVKPNGTVCVYEISGETVLLNGYHVISAQSIIGRGDLISVYDYKIDNTENYSHHMRSRFCEEININKRRFFNLCALSPWQREGSIRRKLMTALENYKVLQITLSGCVDLDLYTRCSFSQDILGDFDDYILHEKTIVSNNDGTKTKLKLKKIIDAKEITYVAK